MVTRHYELTAAGITPLVMNNNSALIAGEDKGRDPAAYEREHYLDKTYRTEDGRLYVPARAIKKAMLLACKFMTQKPKGTRMQSFAPLIEGCLIVDDNAILDVSADKVIPWTIIVNLDPSRGPKGPRGARTRPLIPLPWNAATTITVLDDLLTLDVLSLIAENSGYKCGWLDARNIDMGRCRIEMRAVR